MKEEQLIKEVNQLGIKLTEEMTKKLKQFYQILIEENQKINLTRITDEEDVYLKHFYDSLTLVKAIDLAEQQTLLDIGTGAGFPGIVLKIVFPNLRITLIDAREKRVKYLRETIQKLELEDIEAIHIRSEEYAKKHREEYDIVTSRAVANLKTLAETSIPLVKEGGYFLPMKGKLESELEEAKSMIGICGGKIEETIHFHLPVENSERTILKIKKIKKTDIKYPRNKLK